MARFSQTAGHVKLENGDRVRIMGVPGVVESVMMSKNVGAPHVLVFVRFRNAEVCNVFNFSEIESVRVGNEMWNMAGEAIPA